MTAKIKAKAKTKAKAKAKTAQPAAPAPEPDPDPQPQPDPAPASLPEQGQRPERPHEDKPRLMGLFPSIPQELLLRYQQPEEIGPALDMLKDAGVQSYLEIGSAAGVSLQLAMEKFGKGCKYRFIDPFERKKHNQFLLRTVRAAYDMGYNVHCWNGYSQDPDVVKQVSAQGPYDAILIDGDHAFLPALADIMNYAPMLSENGFLVMHDTDPRGINDGVAKRGYDMAGCRHLWLAVKALLPEDAIAGEWISDATLEGRRFGVGIVHAAALRAVLA